MKNKLDELMYASQELATLVSLTTVLDHYQSSHFEDIQDLVDEARNDLDKATERLNASATSMFNELTDKLEVRDD